MEETPRVKYCIKSVQMLLAVCVLVCIWSFRADGHMYISCDSKNNESDHSNNSVTHGFINFTLRPPFAEQSVLEPFDCNTSHWPPDRREGKYSDSSYLYERPIHPSERLGCLLISAISVMSIIYCICYLYGYAYLRSSVDLFSQKEVMSEVLTSFLLTCCWLVCTISWTASVASLKHFAIFFLPYTTICQDTRATCSLTGSLSSSSTFYTLYYSISFGYASGILWFVCSLWRVYCNSRQVVFPTSLSSGSFSSAATRSHGVSSTSSSSSAAGSFSVLSPAALIGRTLFAFHTYDQRDHVTSAKFTRIHEPQTSSPFHPSYQVTLTQQLADSANTQHEQEKQEEQQQQPHE